MPNAEILVRKSEGGRPLKTPRRESEQNIEICLKEIELENLDFIRQAPDRNLWRIFVNMVMNVRISCPSQRLVIFKKDFAP
jgi:hypothetical protein